MKNSIRLDRVAHPEIIESRWKGLCKLGGVAALIIAVLLAGEIIVYVAFPRPGTALEHFELFQKNWLAGLLTLDLLGMIAYLVFIPTILALYVSLRRTSAAAVAVAVTVFLVGIAVFFATNTAFPVLSLSSQYAAATTEAERAMFLAAGQAMFTLFNENAFLVSYVIVSMAWVIISGVMLRSKVFNRITAYAGLLAGAAGIVAVVLEHIAEYSAIDALLVLAISLYFAAIVFLFVWVVLVGRRLINLSLSA
ncbi:MAG: DUF4386 family protein [Chloroflexi bacterium]|nr:DUF4386 family protein [Chloroflexota bacterium]